MADEKVQMFWIAEPNESDLAEGNFSWLTYPSNELTDWRLPRKGFEKYIHISSYDQLKRENEELRERNKTLSDGSKQLLNSKSEIYAKLLKENDQLRQELAEYKWKYDELCK